MGAANTLDLHSFVAGAVCCMDFACGDFAPRRYLPFDGNTYCTPGRIRHCATITDVRAVIKTAQQQGARRGDAATSICLNKCRTATPDLFRSCGLLQHASVDTGGFIGAALPGESL